MGVIRGLVSLVLFVLIGRENTYIYIVVCLLSCMDKQCIMCGDNYDVGRGCIRAKYCNKCKLEVQRQLTKKSNQIRHEELMIIWRNLGKKEQLRRMNIIAEKLLNGKP